MKILLISGHGAGDPGASSIFGVEATETVVMVQEIKKALDDYADVSLYPVDNNAYSDIHRGGLKVNPANYDYILEVHFNACVQDIKGNGITTGTEIHVTTAESGISVEQAIVKQIAELGFKNRGVKRKNYSVIHTCKKTGTSAALLEVCFIDDKDDMTIYNANKAAVAKAVAKGIVEGFGLKKNTGNGSGSTGQTSGNTGGSSTKKPINEKCASPAEFIRKIAPLCQADYKKHKILPSLSIAQSCLETGYGTSDLYVYASAAFGIKASGGWAGKVFRKNSAEVIDGATVFMDSDFRAYDNLEMSVCDHGEFLQKSRYKKVVGETNFETAAAEILAAGYATDPEYTDKLIEIYKAHKLGQYDSDIPKNPATDVQSGAEPTENASGGISVGSTVKIASGAVYGGLSGTRGKKVPAAQCGSKKHTVAALATHKGVKEAKLKEINSWVAVSSLLAVRNASGGISVGSTVKIASGAVYGGLSGTRGRKIPAAQRGSKKHTVAALATHKGVKEAKLKEINSWVAVKYLRLA